jgi:hypothetical protein
MLAQQSEKSHRERDRLSIILAVMLISATLFRFVELPTFSLGVRQIFGSPLNLALGGDWLLAMLMMGLIATGTLSLMRDHPDFESRERRLIFTLFTPTLGALLASLLLIRASTWPTWLGTLMASGFFIGLLIHLSYRALSPSHAGYPSARVMLNISDYLMGFVLFSLILIEQGRMLVTGPIIFLLSGVLACDLLSASGAPAKRVLLFGAIIALQISELTWVLGYWRISAWTAATLLTLGLYLWSGVGYQYLLSRLTRRVVIEFTIVAALMLVLVLWIRP